MGCHSAFQMHNSICVHLTVDWIRNMALDWAQDFLNIGPTLICITANMLDVLQYLQSLVLACNIFKASLVCLHLSIAILKWMDEWQINIIFFFCPV